MALTDWLGRLHYVAIFAMAALGLGLAAGASQLLKRVLGLALAWSALALFLVAAGYLAGGAAPAVSSGAAARDRLFVNPEPQALALAALPAGVAALVLGLALVVRVRESYGTAEAGAVDAADDAQDEAERQG